MFHKTSLTTTYSNVFLAFVILCLSFLISTTPYPLKIALIKLDLQLPVFQLIAFKVPLISFFISILTFSFLLEIVSGAPSGFYILTYSLSLLPVTYFIQKYVYRVGFWSFFFFLLITSSLKIFITILLLLFFYKKEYLVSFFLEMGLKEFLLNMSVALGLYFLLFMLKKICNSLYILMLRVKQL